MNGYHKRCGGVSRGIMSGRKEYINFITEEFLFIQFNWEKCLGPEEITRDNLIIKLWVYLWHILIRFSFEKYDKTQIFCRLFLEIMEEFQRIYRYAYFFGNIRFISVDSD